MDKSKLTTADFLAIERTKLANERTLLAYLRTFIIMLSSGFAIINLDFLKEINLLGVFLISLSPVVLGFGVLRFFLMKKRIFEFYYKTE